MREKDVAVQCLCALHWVLYHKYYFQTAYVIILGWERVIITLQKKVSCSSYKVSYIFKSYQQALEDISGQKTVLTKNKP